MSTILTPRREEGSHWYRTTGEACHEVPRAKGEGTRKTTLADARKMDLLPSVTTILKAAAKPGLERWKLEQAVLAAVTTPRAPDEPLDAFVARVLDVDAEQESQLARDRGTEIHAEFQRYWEGQSVSPELEEWCKPVYLALWKYGPAHATERVLVGKGYAGTADLIQHTPLVWRIWDYKTCKNVPKEPWSEHRLQLAAYADAFKQSADYKVNPMPIAVGNVYISTQEPGKFAIYEHENWEETYWTGFLHILAFWQFSNNYIPKQ